jgi:hypothetical protein
VSGRRTSAVALALGLALAGCGETSQDAGAGARDTGPADIINMPDGFSNVAYKCNGPNMVYVIYHKGMDNSAQPYGALAVVAGDPRCATSPADR